MEKKLTRAEELALKAYPISPSCLSESNGDGDRNHPRRLAFIEGYRQAEKETLKSVVQWLKCRYDKQGYLDLDDVFELRDALIDFIDFLPEEVCKDSLQVQETCKENQDSFTDEPKEMSVDDAMKYIDEKIAKTRASKSWEGVDVDKFLDEIRGREPDDLDGD
jgi:hypothetical protein